MHDLKDLRKNLNTYKKKLIDRNLDFDLDLFLKVDSENRKFIQKKEQLEQEKKTLSKTKDKSNFEKSKKISIEIEKISEKQKKNWSKY